MNEVGTLIDRMNRGIEAMQEARDALRQFLEIQDRIMRPTETARRALPGSENVGPFTTYRASSRQKAVDQEQQTP